MREVREILPDNPALRLLSILNKAKEIQFSNNAEAGDVWAKILGVNNTPSELFVEYAKLFELVNDAYSKVIQFYPKQTRIHAVWKDGVSTCLKGTSLYHHKWADVISRLRKPDIFDSLQVAADSLSHHVTSVTVNEASIEKLKSEFESLKKKILEEESFTGYLKSFLLRELEKIINALENFDLNGAVPIRNSIYKIVSNEDLSSNTAFPYKGNLAKALGVVLVFIAALNDVAELPESISSIKKMLCLSECKVVETDSSSQKRSLPKELQAFRKEELEETSG